MSIIDIGGQVREGEELNVLAVENWLKQQGIVLAGEAKVTQYTGCLLYTSPSPRDQRGSRMPSSA